MSLPIRTIVAGVGQPVGRAVDAGPHVRIEHDVGHPPVTPHFEPHGGVWPVHCVRETWGAAKADEPDGVHQHRVRVRRLRSILAGLREVKKIPSPQPE